MKARWTWSAAVFAISCLPHLRTLGWGMFMDDLAIVAHLHAWSSLGEGAWWDVFDLAGFDEKARFAGRLPWWTAESMQLRFFRPLAALTHLADHWLWPDSVTMAHAQSVCWMGLLGVAVHRLYREFVADSTVAVVAAVVYAGSYVHGWPVGWIAGRNAVIAAFFGCLCVLSYRRWREKKRGGAVAPVLLLASLLSAEAGVSTMAYIVAYELTFGRAAKSGRNGRLAALFAVVVLWKLAYDAAGFGAVGSGTYIDPIQSPAAFAAVAPQRLAWLAGFLLTPSDLLLAPHLSTPLRVALTALSVAGGVAVLIRSRRTEHRWWVLGSLIALLPLVASMPLPRLLGFAWIGIAPIAAELVVSAWRSRRWGSVAAAAPVALWTLVASPGLLAGALTSKDSRRETEGVGLEIGRVRGRNLVVLDAPSLFHAKTIELSRAAAGKQRPAFTWVLGVDGAAQLSRSGCCTVIVSAPAGLGREPTAAAYRGPHVGFSVGDTVKTLVFEATVREVTRSGQASRVDFLFGGPLESKQYRWIRWEERDFSRVSPAEFPRSD